MRFTVALGACLVLGVVLGSLPGCGGGGGGPGAGGMGGGGGGGASGAGGGAQSVLPSGTVTTCFGDCPKGECDDELFFSDVACSGVYTAPVSPSSPYCNAGQTGAYCLTITSGGTDSRFGITCTSGTATGQMCRSGCASGGGSVTCS